MTGATNGDRTRTLAAPVDKHFSSGEKKYLSGV
jgi:hypothetical protein